MLSTPDRIQLAGAFIQHGLRMEGLALAIAREPRYRALGQRLQWEIGQLKHRSRDLSNGRLEASDLALLLSKVRGSLKALRKRQLPDMMAQQLARECSCLEDNLAAYGISC